jgi:hypothetical protein
MRAPRKVIEYANQALNFPLDETKRLRLFVYKGDAHRLDTTNAPTDRRRSAAESYLSGLRELEKWDFKTPPPPPEPPAFIHRIDQAEADRFMEQQRAKRDAYDRFQEMLRHREVLASQVESMYVRPPNGIQELQDLLTNHLGDSAIGEQILNRVRNGYKEPPKPPGQPTLEPRKTSWLLIANIVAIVLLFTWYVYRRLRRY